MVKNVLYRGFQKIWLHQVKLRGPKNQNSSDNLMHPSSNDKNTSSSLARAFSLKLDLANSLSEIVIIALWSLQKYYNGPNCGLAAVQLHIVYA